MLQLLAGFLVAAPVAVGVAATVPAAASHQVLHLKDPRIAEASSLVAQEGLFLTSNDSGDSGRVFAVDRSGRTVGVTRWSHHPSDVEALAPAGHGSVWVGDIGDNDARRSSVDITRIPVGRGDRTVHATTYRLTYPDGATDAETLMRDPTTGLLYIASKNVFGGLLYAVPEHLDPTRDNRLKVVGRVLPVATDGSFFPDGRHLVVRDYSTAVVYAWPSLQPVGSFPLPAQQQGEGIAVADDGKVYVSSEGLRSPVLQVTLPPKIAAAVAPAVSASPGTPSPGGTSSSTSADPSETEPASRDAWPWVAGGLLALVALVVLLRAVRPR
jgi:hypothetical protein